MRGVTEQSSHPGHLEIRISPTLGAMVISAVFSLLGLGLVAAAYAGLLPEAPVYGVNGVIVGGGILAAVCIFAHLHARRTAVAEIIDLDRAENRMTLTWASRRDTRTDEYAISDVDRVRLKHHERTLRPGGRPTTVYQVALALNDGETVDINREFEPGDRLPYVASALSESLNVELERHEAEISMAQMAAGVRAIAGKGKAGASKEELKAMTEAMIKKLRDGDAPEE